MKRSLFLAMLLAGLALPAVAHEPRKGPNGGALVDAGQHHVELVTDGTETVVLYLSDLHDKPVAATGYKANAILIVGGKPLRFMFDKVEGAKITGRAPASVPAGVKGAVQLIGPDGATSQAKF